MRTERYILTHTHTHHARTRAHIHAYTRIHTLKTVEILEKKRR